MAKLNISARAEEDIKEVVNYIADDNLDASLRFYSGLLDCFELLAENPNAGRDRSDLKEDLRYFPFKSYLIFYRIWAKKITIVRVLHSARDLDELFS